MKVESVSHPVYLCEFCSYKVENVQSMTHHEHTHKRTARYSAGQRVIWHTGSYGRAHNEGYGFHPVDYPATVVQVDVEHCKLMVEKEDGERAWAYIENIADVPVSRGQ